MKTEYNLKMTLGFGTSNINYVKIINNDEGVKYLGGRFNNEMVFN